MTPGLTSSGCLSTCTSAPGAGWPGSPTTSTSGSRCPAAVRSAGQTPGPIVLMTRTGPSLSYVRLLVPVTRPSRRSRGGCGTSSDATGGNGIRNGWEWNDRLAGLSGMTRRRPPPWGPLPSWTVRTLSGRTCSRSCLQLPGGSHWDPSPARTPRMTRHLSCFTSLTSRSTTGPNSASCVTCTDMTVASPPALRTQLTATEREGSPVLAVHPKCPRTAGSSRAGRAPEPPPKSPVPQQGGNRRH